MLVHQVKAESATVGASQLYTLLVFGYTVDLTTS